MNWPYRASRHHRDLETSACKENTAGFLHESEAEINEFAAMSTFHGQARPYCEPKICLVLPLWRGRGGTTV